MMELGPESAFQDLPAAIDLDGQRFFVVRTDGAYKLLSSLCPHQGGRVRDTGQYLECPQHGWRFDRTTGAAITARGQSLASYDIEVRDGRLHVDLPARTQMRRQDGGRPRPVTGLRMRLLAHACLELQHSGSTLVVDPWLEGPAFLGAWIQYPPSAAKASDLRPTAILLTHEHSDHFHPETLASFSRDLPICFPAFPNRRMERALARLGFRDLRPIRFGEPAEIGKMRVTLFEPAGIWNDAIALIETEGFRLLNLNDAGLNYRIASLVGPVDAISASFSQGASGYPQTWTHLGEEEKTAIMSRANEGILRMLREAAELYGARYLVPFASHFALWHPDHRRFADRMERNSLQDVIRGMADSRIEVIDLLPGDSWEVATGEIQRSAVQRGTDRAALGKYLEEAFNPDVFARFHPKDEPIAPAAFRDYFLRLNDIPEIAFCEDLTVVVKAFDSRMSEELASLSFEVRGGVLRILTDPPAEPNLVISLPRNILAALIRDDISWDEAHIGYWCRLSRNPDTYHAGFWRLLQAPYYCRSRKPAEAEAESHALRTVVADLLERHGDPADRILRRYGLYCSGCHYSPKETLEAAAKRHGLDSTRTRRLAHELARVFDGARANAAHGTSWARRPEGEFSAAVLQERGTT